MVGLTRMLNVYDDRWVRFGVCNILSNCSPIQDSVQLAVDQNYCELEPVTYIYEFTGLPH